MTHDVQKIVDDILDGSDEWTEQLPELLEDPQFRQQYLALMTDESLLAKGVAVEADRRKLNQKTTQKSNKKLILLGAILAAAAALAFAFLIFNQ